MPDAIDNLAQALNESNTVDEFPGYPGYKLGDLVPGMAGVRIGDTDFYGTDAYGQKAPYNWRTGVFEFAAPPTTPTNPDSQFESYLAGIKDLQAPVSSPSKPYTPTFTPMAAPPAVRVYPPATPANPDSQFENYLAGIKDLQDPVSRQASPPSQPSAPTFTPMAAPPAVRVTPPTQFGPVTASGYAQPPVDPMSYYSNPSTASLSNPSTLGGGSEIDYNVRDQPVERINIGNTDEKDARVYTPRNQEQYIKGNEVLVSPYQSGGTVGVEYLDPSQVAAITAGQKPSVPQGVVTRGETVKIPGKGLPNYEVIGNMDDGSVIYLDPKTRDTFVVPGVKDYPGVVDLSNLPEVVSNVGGGGFRQGTRAVSTPLVPFQETAASVGASEPATTSQGGFDNTGGNVTAVSSGTTNVTPGYKESEKGPGINPFIDSPYRNAGIETISRDFIDPSTGKEHFNGTGDRWNFRLGEWDYADVPATTTPPVTTPTPGGGTPKPPKPGDGGATPTPGTGTGTTPTPGGGGQPPTGGTKPGGVITGPAPGTGTGTYTGNIPPREPVTPLVRREVVIPTKGTKEVPLPDRQADPFAKLYADLLANAQQQKDQYRYINYDPEQIMNAAMSGFRRRGAMRSLQGY